MKSKLFVLIENFKICCNFIMETAQNLFVKLRLKEDTIPNLMAIFVFLLDNLAIKFCGLYRFFFFLIPAVHAKTTYYIMHAGDLGSPF